MSLRLAHDGDAVLSQIGFRGEMKTRGHRSRKREFTPSSRAAICLMSERKTMLRQDSRESGSGKCGIGGIVAWC